jgi:hypothetical protein
MHKLTLTIEVDEHDDDIEQEICLKLRKIFLTSVQLLDFSANHVATTNIERDIELV